MQLGALAGQDSVISTQSGEWQHLASALAVFILAPEVFVSGAVSVETSEQHVISVALT